MRFWVSGVVVGVDDVPIVDNLLAFLTSANAVDTTTVTPSINYVFVVALISVFILNYIGTS